ncbi:MULTISPECIES: hypothetical protein [unclassified Lacticaseibacillus]|uniref:hypothetical protein n=1 Tax=unclassified Lacticaseibacillus TaxID=2759744 RepID=UPI0019434BCA|nr:MULTISPECIES: hypothetical protein [unclassified Lacticaseibacillus]
MTITLNILIFLITGGLLATTLARLKQPVDYVVTGLVALILLLLASKFFGWGWFTILYLLWMVAIVAGLLVLRTYLRAEKKAR